MDIKDVPMEVKTIIAKWYSSGYTPSFTHCPSCDEIIGWHPKEERCWNCGQKLIWKREEK